MLLTYRILQSSGIFDSCAAGDHSAGAHKAENWALDSVTIHSEVSEIDSADHVRSVPKVNGATQNYKSAVSLRLSITPCFNRKYPWKQALAC